MNCLKNEFGMGHGYASLVSQPARRAPASEEGTSDLVAAQYSGAKAGLGPIHDKLTAVIRGLGTDVELTSRKTYVSLRRSKQSGLIQLATRTRVDFGLNLSARSPTLHSRRRGA